MASLMTGAGRLMARQSFYHSDKKVIKYICQGYSVPLLQLIVIPNGTFRRQLLIPNHHKGVQDLTEWD